MTKQPKQASKKSGLNRRNYIKATVSAAALAAVGKNAVAASDSYDVVEVPEGERELVRVNSGETLENVLFDIDNPGAYVRILADGDDWTIRNVGIRGHWDLTDDNSVIHVNSDDPDDVGRIENVHIGITTEGDGSMDGPTGIKVNRGHTGTLIVDHTWIQECPDNGIYASSPGHDASSAGGGDTIVRNSYITNCNTSAIRFGTSGSYAENCVMVDGRHRGFKGQYEHTELIDCDIVDSGSHDIELGTSNYEKGKTAEVTVTNTRYDPEAVNFHNGSYNEIHGSSAGTPQDRIPDGCPTTPEEAASGKVSEDTNTSEGEPYVPEGDFELQFTTDSDLAEYLVELDAANVEPGDGADTHEHEFQDRAFEHDGLWYVHGYTGSSESFTVQDGEILRTGQLQGEVQLTADGQAVDVDAFGTIESVPEGEEVHRLEVAGQFEYRIEVDGEIAPAEEHAQWLTEGESYGTDWAEWWLSGSDDARTIWEYTGEITNIEIDDYDGTTEIRTLAVDGEELDHSQYVDTGPYALEVAGQFEYRVEVDGEIWPAEEHAQWLTEGESYGTDWAEWWLSGSDDARTVWMFTGDITTLDISDYDGATEIRTLAVDGDAIDPNNV